MATEIPGIDITTEVVVPAEQEQIVLLTDGAENLVTIDANTGEIIAVDGAPADSAEVEEIVKWVGGRRAFALAKAAGITAERDQLLAKINAQYTPQINYYTRFAEWTTVRYYGILKDYARRVLAGGKIKTAKVHLLALKFGTTRYSIDITDPEKALDWARQYCPEGIKTTESVLKTEVSKVIEEAEALPVLAKTKKKKATRGRAAAAASGIVVNPGGEETFSIQ